MTGKKNLAVRKNDDYIVGLWYDFDAEQCEVIVNVISRDEDFVLYPPNCKALDCYFHPFAYANRVLQRGTFADPIAA